MSRFPSGPLIIRYPFSYYSVLIREPKKKKGKRVLLGHLVVLRDLRVEVLQGSRLWVKESSCLLCFASCLLRPTAQIC